ncbi:MAG: hypothetical protein WBI82_01840 [Sphaerochaeta sp.]
MKKAILMVICTVSLLFLIGCVTGGTENIAKQKTFERGDYRYEDENLVVLISVNKELASNDYFDFDLFVEFTFENKTGEGISLITDYFSYNFSSGKVVKLLPGETKQLHSALSSPQIAIPPRSTIKKTFYFVEDSEGAYMALKYIVNPTLENAYLVFGYNKDGKETIATVTAADSTNTTTYSGYVYRDPNLPIPEYKEKLGQVIAENRTWNVLFLKPIEDRRQILLDMATQQAKEEYGDDIILANVRYNGMWNPLSLLLYFSMFGFVEDATITADVLGS